MTTIAVGNRRLLRLAKILDTADALHKKRGEPKYSQDRINHPCGTPACAWGHYTANTRRDLCHWYSSYTRSDTAEGEFAMSHAEVEDMFGGDGCNKATTAKQAAKYIRAFVKRRSKS